MAPSANASVVKELKKVAAEAFKVYAPDGKRFVMSKLDEKCVYQAYVGKDGDEKLECITSTQQEGGPKPERHKMQIQWHPSGKWIFMAVERDKYDTPPILGANKDFVEGELQCGLWTNMYAVTPDGKRWRRLTDFKSSTPGTPDGFTGPAFTPDGKKAVWSQIVDGNILAYWPFGKWELTEADVEENDGLPALTHQKNITPKGMHWNEPGNFSPDNETLLVSGSTEKDAQGMDQYVLNIKTGKLTNLTKTTDVWDEHGVFSPDGKKIIFMSAYPYRSDPNSSKVLTIRTEFMLMNKDGSGLTQLSHFREPGHAQYSEKTGIAACAVWSADGRSAQLCTLVFPKYEYYRIEFAAPAASSGDARPKLMPEPNKESSAKVK
ncbi:MAG: PD40 domain-containing protein [Planctomycetes bacterium]|nr:PD40 domain-containing protein [Planctomycetota bacterium]